MATIAIGCLAIFWIAIWFLDLGYYNRLLEGSVYALLELEARKTEFLNKRTINLSTSIEDAFKDKFKHEKKWWQALFKGEGRICFYSIVLIALILLICYTGYMWYSTESAAKTPPSRQTCLMDGEVLCKLDLTPEEIKIVERE